VRATGVMRGRNEMIPPRMSDERDGEGIAVPQDGDEGDF
jgi:hypothetical protein